MRVAFGAFELDTDAVELRHRGDPVAVEPRVFDVLVHLVRHRDRVVPKEELLDEVWGDRFVSESALSSCVRHIRRVLGDDGLGQRFVRTSRGRGYRFVAPVEAAPRSGRSLVLQTLPPDRTPLFGRDDEIVAAADAVAGHRLVTLLGMGGVGKTRLAVAVGRAVLDRFGDGVWFVDLSSVDRERSVAVAIAHAGGVALSSGDATAQLAGALADREALVVLDGAEHVRPALGAVVDQLLDRTSGPHFLVTSRGPVGLPGERLVRVAPLGLGVDASDAAPAVELFLSVAARLDAAIGPDDLGVVRRICEQLDGLPLAIELAAAQLRVLGPGQVADRLDGRFELLRDPAADPGARHASLTSVLDDTWALLAPAERVLLGRLTGFPGPFAVTDVEQLCRDAASEVVSTLGRLVDQSLVSIAPGQSRRFRLLDTVRAFARERSDGADAGEVHARWCLEQVGDDFGAHLFDFGLAAWCGERFDDLRLAVQHLLAAGRAEEAARLTSATALAMHSDEGARAASVLDRIDRLLPAIDDAALRARLHCTAAMAAMAARSPGSIATHGHAAVAQARRADDSTLVAVALVLASWSTTLEDPLAALAMVEEAAAIAAADLRARDHAAAYRAFHLAMRRRYDEAVAVAEAVIDRSPGGETGGLGRFVAVVAWSACNVLAGPPVSGRYVDELLMRPTPASPMWGNVVLAAAIRAAIGDAPGSARLVAGVRERLRRRGQDPLPDLLVAAAALALHRHDERRVARYLLAVRDADRPTQSFPVTCAYRRMRDAVDLRDAATSTATLEQVGAEALAWVEGFATKS